MPAPVQADLDPVNLMITVLAAWLGPSLSQVLGPYAVILLASTAGAAWSLGRRDPTERRSAIWFFLRVNLTACVLTSGIATLLSKAYTLSSLEWTFAPIAFGLGLVGDDWPAVRGWLGERITNIIDRRAAQKD